MPADGLYIETSALARGYLNELGSVEFNEFLRRRKRGAISRLVVLELRCLLARRGRAGEITSTCERDALADFDDDVRRGVLLVLPLADSQVVEGRDLIDRLGDHPLRALDALHLAIAWRTSGRTIATADRVLAQAADHLGLQVVRFG